MYVLKVDTLMLGAEELLKSLTPEQLAKLGLNDTQVKAVLFVTDFTLTTHRYSAT